VLVLRSKNKEISNIYFPDNISAKRKKITNPRCWFWSEPQSGKVAGPHLPDSDSPFFIVGCKVFSCMHGPDQHKKKKEKRKAQKVIHVIHYLNIT